APPRMFPSIGFIDHHKSGVVELAANPYAAMPSLHAADALIVGLVLASLVRRPVWKVLWLVWPLWVCFAVMATGNHFWLDVLARAGGKTTPFGAFLASTTDRIGEGAMLGAIALIFHRHDHPVAIALAFAAVLGSLLVSYTRAKAEGLGLRGDVGIGSRAERVV